MADFLHADIVRRDADDVGLGRGGRLPNYARDICVVGLARLDAIAADPGNDVNRFSGFQFGPHPRATLASLNRDLEMLKMIFHLKCATQLICRDHAPYTAQARLGIEGAAQRARYTLACLFDLVSSREPGP